MDTTTESTDDGPYESPIDPKIMVGVMCGVTFVLATITVAICCSCGWKRKPPPKKPQQKPQQQAFTVPVGSGGAPGQTTIIVVDGSRQPGSLPGYNQQRPGAQPVQPFPGPVHPGTQPRPHPGQHPGSHPGQHPGSHPGQHSGAHPGQHPGQHPGTHLGQYPGQHPGQHPGTHVARAQNPGHPQQAQGASPVPTESAKLTKKQIKEKKKEEKKLKKQKNDKTQKEPEKKNENKEFRMSGLEDKPAVEANSYIRMEVPAPSSDLDKSLKSNTLDPNLEGMAKLVAKSIAKTLAAINIVPERIIRQDVLGSGQFGVVYRGELASEDRARTTPVALKTVAGDANDESDLQEFMDEVLRMKTFNHRNVMPMLGITIMEQKPYMVLPYMEKGDLKSLLAKPAEVFTVEDLMRLALHISRGMEYLAAQNIIHGDLAARNCMVSQDDSVKVADFGLSRHLFRSDYYSLTDSETLRPYRWMAVECLTDKRFTSKSDVWSFGVVIWEIMTRGRRPYPDYITNKDVGLAIEGGYRMPCPQYCADEIYDVMRRCWEADSANRPSFKDTTKMIELLLDKAGGDYEKPLSASDTHL